MKIMRQPMLKAIASLILVAALSAPAFGANPARPGSINYIEGQASIAGQPLDAKAIGSAELQAGQTPGTQIWKKGVFMTPGAFLLLGDKNSLTQSLPPFTHTGSPAGQRRARARAARAP